MPLRYIVCVERLAIAPSCYQPKGFLILSESRPGAEMLMPVEMSGRHCHAASCCTMQATCIFGESYARCMRFAGVHDLIVGRRSGVLPAKLLESHETCDHLVNNTESISTLHQDQSSRHPISPPSTRKQHCKILAATTTTCSPACAATFVAQRLPTTRR